MRKHCRKISRIAARTVEDFGISTAACHRVEAAGFSGASVPH
jgi:hypothetical protein